MAVIDEIKIEVKAEVDKAVQGLNSVEGATKKVDKAFKALEAGTVILLAIKAITKLISTGKDLYNEFANDELATVRLNAALANAEQIGAGAADRFSELALALQKTTIFSEDVIKSQAAELAALGKTEDQIKKMILAATDLASATGIDLETAITQLNATLQGNAGILGRQNAAVRALTEEELKAGKAIDVVSEQYKGFAQEVGESSYGATIRLANAWGEVREKGGEAIAKFITPMVEGLADLLNGQEAISQSDYISEWIKQIDMMNEAMARSPGVDFGEKIAELEKRISLMKALNIEFEKQVAAEKASYEYAYKWADLHYKIKLDEEAKAAEAKARAEALYLDSRSQVLSIIEGEKTEQEKILETIKALEKTPWGSGTKLEEDRLRAIEILRNKLIEIESAQESISELAEKESKAREESAKNIEDFYDSAIQGNETINSELDRQYQTVEDQASAVERIIELWDDASDFVSRYGDAIDMASSALSAFGDLQENQSDARIAGLEAERDAMEEAGLDTLAIEEEIADAKNEAAEKEFNAKKLTSIAEAIINTAVAVTESAANPILAGIIAALGAAQVGAIGAQQYVPFAQGGIVTGPTRALIGEAGPEAVIPLRDMGKGLSVGGGVTIVQNVGGSIWTTKELERLAVGAVATAGRGF